MAQQDHGDVTALGAQTCLLEVYKNCGGVADRSCQVFTNSWPLFRCFLKWEDMGKLDNDRRMVVQYIIIRLANGEGTAGKSISSVSAIPIPMVIVPPPLTAPKTAFVSMRRSGGRPACRMLLAKSTWCWRRGCAAVLPVFLTWCARGWTGPHERLIESLDRIFAESIDPQYNRDSIEGKVFGLGVESYTAGSHDFYANYALTSGKAEEVPDDRSSGTHGAPDEGRSGRRPDPPSGSAGRVQDAACRYRL